jgi:ATP-binding cassette subfamily F protein uup
MDEPTNDLDTETLELLEEQLLNYAGTLLMVSHDRAFLDNVVTSILAMSGNGIVEECVGNYQDYIDEKRKAAAEAKAAAARPGRAASRHGAAKRLGFNEKRELSSLPRQIEKLESAQASLHEKMAAPNYYQMDPEHMAEDTEQVRRTTEELARVYARWETLEALKGG